MSFTIYYADSLDQAIRDYQSIVPIYVENGKLSPLQRWLKGTIDFDQICVINDAYHIDRMGSGGHFVAISIQTISKETIYREWALENRHITITKEEYDKHPVYPNSNIAGMFFKWEHTIQEDVKKCQEVIVNDLLKYWRLYKEERMKLS